MWPDTWELRGSPRLQNSGHGEIIHAIGTGRRPRRSRRAGLYRRRSTARGATDRIKKACRAHRLQRPTSQQCSQVALHPPALELRENGCETTDMADDRAPYVQSSGLPRRQAYGRSRLHVGDRISGLIARCYIVVVQRCNRDCDREIGSCQVDRIQWMWAGSGFTMNCAGHLPEQGTERCLGLAQAGDSS